VISWEPIDSEELDLYGLKSRPPDTGQFIKIPFALIDNPKFRNVFLKKGIFRTYLFLARKIVRCKMIFDPMGLYENYYLKNKLATWYPLRVLGKKLNIGKSTAFEHVRDLFDTGTIRIVEVPSDKSFDGQKHLIYVLGYHIDGKEAFYINEIYGDDD
jgi:hypothetical protein